VVAGDELSRVVGIHASSLSPNNGQGAVHSCPRPDFQQRAALGAAAEEAGRLAIGPAREHRRVGSYNNGQAPRDAASIEAGVDPVSWTGWSSPGSVKLRCWIPHAARRQEYSMGRRGYPPEFRRKVLDLVEAGRPIAEIAKALGSAPSPSTPGAARTASTKDELQG
jgi:hypothetical protein